MHDTLLRHVDHGRLPGLVALISRRGAEHVDAIGALAFDRNAPMRPDTIVRLASVTKPITAVAAMILVEERKLRLDDAVDEFLPEPANRKVLRTIDGELRSFASRAETRASAPGLFRSRNANVGSSLNRYLALRSARLARTGSWTSSRIFPRLDASTALSAVMLTPASASVRPSAASVPGRDTRLSVSWVVLGIAVPPYELVMSDGQTVGPLSLVRALPSKHITRYPGSTCLGKDSG